MCEERRGEYPYSYIPTICSALQPGDRPPALSRIILYNYCVGSHRVVSVNILVLSLIVSIMAVEVQRVSVNTLLTAKAWSQWEARYPRTVHLNERASRLAAAY